MKSVEFRENLAAKSTRKFTFTVDCVIDLTKMQNARIVFEQVIGIRAMLFQLMHRCTIGRHLFLATECLKVWKAEDVRMVGAGCKDWTGNAQLTRPLT